MTLGRELRAIDVINRWGLWMISMTQGHEFRDLVVMNNSGLWMT